MLDLAITAHASFVSMMKFGNYSRMLLHGPKTYRHMQRVLFVQRS